LEYWQVNWIAELAVNKSTRYPNFRSLTLQERITAPYREMYEHFDTRDRRELQLPEDLKLAFETNAMALRCWVNKEALV
jgi:hypothetical protein